MADIRPFRALRYDPGKVKLEDVLTQPYDKISPKMQEEYYRRSPHNLVRFELGKPDAADSDADNVYTRAKAFVAEQLRSGALMREESPYLYGYRQRFEHPLHKGEWLTRNGFIALGRIYDYDEGVVFRHEQTLSKPKADRLNLLRTARVHSGQIFMLYEDAGGDIDRLLGDLITETDQPEVVDDYGVRNQLSFIAGDALQRLMHGRKLIIADGHHRYETALTYRNEQRAHGAVEGPHEWVMMTFVSMESPALIILPTHRVVFGLERMTAEELSGRLHEWFEIEMLTTREPDVICDALSVAGRESTAFAVVTADAALILKVRRERTARILSSYTEMQRRLDVLTLHKVILEHALGISEEAIREQTNVHYHRWAADAIKDVDAGANAAFLMNAVSVELLRDLTFAGTLMPQKSTDFYPKLLSGIALYALDETLAGKSAFGTIA